MHGPTSVEGDESGPGLGPVDPVRGHEEEGDEERVLPDVDATLRTGRGREAMTDRRGSEASMLSVPCGSRRRELAASGTASVSEVMQYTHVGEAQQLYGTEAVEVAGNGEARLCRAI